MGKERTSRILRGASCMRGIKEKQRLWKMNNCCDVFPESKLIIDSLSGNCINGGIEAANEVVINSRTLSGALNFTTFCQLHHECRRAVQVNEEKMI